MKNKRTLVERLTFCESLTKWLTEKLRQILCAEGVTLTDGKFIIIEEYDVTESYYGHQLVQPIGGEMPFMQGLKFIIKDIAKKKPHICHYPEYSEVFTTLTPIEVHKCFIAYEVLCIHANNLADSMATKYLKHVASSHHWDYNTFMDIIDEEYNCIYNK